MHDIGGVDGFGFVDVDPGDVPFHEDWERKACGMTMAFMGAGLTNEAELRHAIERLPAEEYVRQSYWERWVSGLATLMIEKGLATATELAELAGSEMILGRRAVYDALEPASGVGWLEAGTRVRVREWHPRGHTRCPRYVQGRIGTVVRMSGNVPLPDRAIAADATALTEPVYCVRFESTELWGEGGRPGEVVHLDLWQTYLEVLP